MKYIVSATQLITQDVEFVVDVPDEEVAGAPPNDVSAEEWARSAVETPADDRPIDLYDTHDETYHRNIVTNVRPATEEESK